jgi:hypothetical protein
VFQTAGIPPNIGRIILANIGSIQKRRAALTNKDIKKKNCKIAPPQTDKFEELTFRSIWSQFSNFVLIFSIRQCFKHYTEYFFEKWKLSKKKRNKMEF